MVAKWAHPVLCTGDFILEDLGRFKCGHMAKEGAKASARLIIYYYPESFIVLGTTSSVSHGRRRL